MTKDQTDIEIWTSERISRFWDLVAAEPRLQHKYFSLLAAKDVIIFARLFGLNGGDVLDYGCGPGYLSQELVIQGISTTGTDYSKMSIQKSNELLNGQPHWKGAFSPTELIDNKKYSWIFSLETFEHLRDEWIYRYFSDIFNKLLPGGMLLLTTPFQENLDHELIICPNCETKFHRWGHLRSVSQKKIITLLKSHGFEIEICLNINLTSCERLHKYFAIKTINNLIEISPTGIIKYLKIMKIFMIKNILKKEKDKTTLVVIAKKS